MPLVVYMPKIGVTELGSDTFQMAMIAVVSVKMLDNQGKVVSEVAYNRFNVPVPKAAE